MLNYEVTGNPDGPTLVLMHGFMSSNAQWDLNVAPLGEHLQLVLVELMGHGASPTPDDPVHYQLASTMATLESIRESLGLNTWWAGGHSMGGATAIRYAMANPDVVNGVVFTNTRAAFALARVGAQDMTDIGETVEDLRALPYHPINARRFPEDLKTRLVEAADRMHPFALQQVIANRSSLSSVDDLDSLEVPAMLINGRYERAFQPCVSQATAALPALEVIELEGGHSVNVEEPDGYNAAVLKFVMGET